MNYMLMPFKRYADFNGRSRRKEFWSWFLLNLAIVGVLMIIMVILISSSAARYVASSGYGTSSYSYRSSNQGFEVFASITGAAVVPFMLAMLWGLVAFIPNLAVTIRRLHDQDKSGWFYLLTFIPFVGPFILLIFMFMEGTPGPNQYGPDPKNPYGDPGYGGGYGGGGYGGQGGGYPPQPYGGPPPGQPYGAPPHQGGGYPPPPYGGPQGGPPQGGGWG